MKVLFISLSLLLACAVAFVVYSTSSTDSTEGKISLEELFEGSTPLSGVYKETAASYSLQYVSSPAYQGSRAARFELRDTDPMVNSGTRTEAMITQPASSAERWYSFAAYFPADGYAKDSKPELISQWHQYPDEHLGESWTSPPTSLLVQNDQFILDVRHDAQPVTSGYMLETQKLLNLGTVTKDTWHEFVFHIVHSYGSDGLIEVWRNGTKVLEHRGGNMLNNAKLPHWKVGVYKWLWNGTGTTDTNRRVLYMDNIRVGNASATLQDMRGSTLLTKQTSILKH